MYSIYTVVHLFMYMWAYLYGVGLQQSHNKTILFLLKYSS